MQDWKMEDLDNKRTFKNDWTCNNAHAVKNSKGEYLRSVCGVCALVPCGHSRFCTSCADTVTALGNGCPLCRALINMVLRLFCLT